MKRATSETEEVKRKVREGDESGGETSYTCDSLESLSHGAGSPGASRKADLEKGRSETAVPAPRSPCCETAVGRPFRWSAKAAL